MLAQQGFVAKEPRGNRMRYKLRFRVGGEQRVRCLGSDPARAEQVRLAVESLQAPRQQQLALGAACKDTRRAVRASLRVLGPLLESAGYHLHGTAVRKVRPRSS